MTTTGTRTSAELRNGWDRMIINLDHTREDIPDFKTVNGQITMTISECDIYRVSVTGMTHTAHGWWAGDTRTASFRDENEAKANANGWFNSLIKRGFKRTA